MLRNVDSLPSNGLSVVSKESFILLSVNVSYTGNTFFIHTTSLGIVGAKVVLFFNKSSNDVIFVELELVVLHGSSLTQSVVVQFPFSHFVVILVRNCV